MIEEIYQNYLAHLGARFAYPGRPPVPVRAQTAARRPPAARPPALAPGPGVLSFVAAARALAPEAPIPAAPVPTAAPATAPARPPDRPVVRQHPAAPTAPAARMFSAPPEIRMEIPTGETRLAVFLGNPISMPTYQWVAQEPPDPSVLPHDIIVNFETDGVDVHRSRAIGVTIGTLDGQLKRYLPFAHLPGGNLNKDMVFTFLRDLKGHHIHNANMRFDVHIGLNDNISFEDQNNTVTDIFHTAALLDDHRREFKLDRLAKDYLGGVALPRVDESMMAQYHPAQVAPRAEYQAQLVSELHAVMRPEIEKQDLGPVQTLEDSVIYPVVEMERNGAPMDMELLEAFEGEYQRCHDELLWEISREVGFAFDHSNASWQRLFERHGIPVSHLETLDKKTGDNKETFADSIIAMVDIPIFKKARFAKQLSQLNSKTFKAYRENTGSDNVLRFELHQLRGEKGGTVSGRFSAPYIQQVPNAGNHYATFDVGIYGLLYDMFPRRLFVPEFGADYLAADAAQIQYRIFASHAKNPGVLAAYKEDPRVSFHRLIMAKIQPYKPDIIYEHLKSMNFMIIFGGKLLKIAIMMGYISEAEAEEIRERKAWNDPRLATAQEIQNIYNREMPEVEPMLAKAAHLAMSYCDKSCLRKTKITRDLHRKYPHRGYVKTVMGRRSRFPDNNRAYKAFCMVDQGSEGDIVKTNIAILHRERKHTGLKMRMTVHDEICGDAQMPETKDRVAEILNTQRFPELCVPILWDVGVGPNWAETKGNK